MSVCGLLDSSVYVRHDTVLRHLLTFLRSSSLSSCTLPAVINVVSVYQFVSFKLNSIDNDYRVLPTGQSIIHAIARHQNQRHIRSTICGFFVLYGLSESGQKPI